MADTNKVLLILGAGPNLGRAIASKFAANGYKIALAARSLSNGPSEDGSLQIKADFSNPSVVREVFAKTIDTLGHPSVVVYNGPSKKPIFIPRTS